MSKEEQGQGNNPRPKTQQGPKKVFDVVRPGKSPAAPNSRSVIVGHKPQVPDDQFVPSANTRLAGNPADKRPLMDFDKKVGVEPVSDAFAPSAPQLDEQPVAVAAEKMSEPQVATLPSEPAQSEEPVVASVTEPAPTSPEPDESSVDQTPQPTDAVEFPIVEAEPKPTLEHLAVEQVVETPEDTSPAISAAPDQTFAKPMTQDDVLAHTDAPTLERPVVSHHPRNSHTKAWEWILIFLLIVLIAATAINFLLDAEVVTTTLDIPHTDLIKN